MPHDDMHGPVPRAGAVSELVELTPTECRQHLERGGVGRLAFQTPRGLRIVPLNYVTNPGVVVFRTLPTSELGTYGDGAEAVFEIDEIDPVTEQGWSVVAFGRLEGPSATDEVWDVHGWRNPTPWSGGPRVRQMRLRWEVLTGRRIVRRDAPT